MTPSPFITNRTTGRPYSLRNQPRRPERADARTIALRLLVWSAAILPWVAALVVLINR